MLPFSCCNYGNAHTHCGESATRVPILSAQGTALDAIAEQPLFISAAQAVRFAVTRDGKYGRPLFAKMVVSDGDAVRSLGLGPVDAAAQAGMIFATLRALPRVGLATLIAKTAPAVIACECRRPCCSGKRMSAPWREAVDTIAVESQPLLPDLSHKTRVALIVKVYSTGVTLARIAKDSGLELELLAREHRALLRWLQGSRVRGDEGVEFAAWREAESLLREAGIVGAMPMVAYA